MHKQEVTILGYTFYIVGHEPDVRMFEAAMDELLTTHGPEIAMRSGVQLVEVVEEDEPEDDWLG